MRLCGYSLLKSYSQANKTTSWGVAPPALRLASPKHINAFATLRELSIYGLRPAPPYGRCEHLGALPQTPRSPRGRGAGRAAYGLLTYPPAHSVWSFQRNQGFGYARNAHPFGAQPAACAPRAASAFALDTASTFERNQGQDLMGGTRP